MDHATKWLLLLGFLIVWGLTDFSSTLATCQQEQYVKAQQSPEKGCGLAQSLSYRIVAAGVDWIDAKHDFVTAAATLIVALFTFTLWRATDKLWRAGEDQMALIARNAATQAADTKKAIATAIMSNQIAVTNAEQQLRAYITAKDVNIIFHREPGRIGTYTSDMSPGRVHTYGFAAILRNGGQTPGTNVTINVSCERFTKTLPADFVFPDSTSFGYGLIGPDSEMHTPTIRIAAPDFEASDGEWYLWGWVEYDDIFAGSIRHRTEFCFTIDRVRLSDSAEPIIGVSPCQLFNAVDDGCMRPVDPPTGKSGQ
jgi:hypothetical protein